MIETNKQITKNGSIALGKQRNYNEIVELLDKSWSIEPDKTLEKIKKLDKALGQPSAKINAVFVAGTNGKSLTINFVTQLLKEDGFKVGSFYSPHILTYNERIALSNETISNKMFMEIANEVLNAAESQKLKLNSSELLTMMAILTFSKNNSDLAIFEVGTNNVTDPVNICLPKILAITRITADKIMVDEGEEEKVDNTKVQELIKEITNLIRKDTWVVSADQSKLSLQVIENIVKEKAGNWIMPIRKLVTLEYPFEQLHGRCAALAERIAQIYVEKFTKNNSTIISDSLLVKPKGQRGRPTLEAKKQLETNPRRTVEQFWKETTTTLNGRFQLLDKEKPSIILDSASNIDALSNLLLGIRLLHYKRTLKGLTIILGAENNNFNNPEFLKLIRYFFKKTSGQIIFCPIVNSVFTKSEKSFDVEQIISDAKNIKVKAKFAKNFTDAFEMAKQTVDERQGLVVITGSNTIINEYWNYKGIKKL